MLPNVNRQVTVTLTGRVSRVDEKFHFFLEGPNLWLNHHRCTWEYLPEPEPEWQPGDVVRDAEGDLFVRDSTGWRRASGIPVADDYPVRPLTRLVPES